MPISGAQRRRKGHDWERQVARELRQWWSAAKRSPQYDQRSDSSKADVHAGPLMIECKRGVAPHPLAALRQAQACVDEATAKGEPIGLAVSCCKLDGKNQYKPSEAVICMAWGDFLAFLEEVMGPPRFDRDGEPLATPSVG